MPALDAGIHVSRSPNMDGRASPSMTMTDTSDRARSPQCARAMQKSTAAFIADFIADFGKMPSASCAIAP